MQHERHERHQPAGGIWSPGAIADMATAWTDIASDMVGAFDSFVTTLTDRPIRADRTHRRQGRKHGGRCERCRPDTCHCECCVYDADLVVYARYGERRVVPVRVSNERSRARSITLDLSSFTTSGGSPSPVTGTIATPSEFELGPCEDEEVIVLIGIAGKIGAAKETVAIREELVAAEAAEAAIDVALPDVDDCHVAYADLRIQGCDVRPVRMAVAVLPRDCDAHEVHCACGCC